MHREVSEPMWSRRTFLTRASFGALSILQSLDNAYRHTYSPSSGYELFAARRVH